jgi:hypothetical protein
MDYSRWPDRNYLQLHLINFDPRLVELIWYALAGAAYLGLLWLARKASKAPDMDSPPLLMDALAFCALPLLSPFAHRIAFVVLLWPAMVAGALLARRGFPSQWAKALIYAAVVIETLEPMFSTAKMQRLFQVIGVDFWAACILTAGLLIASMEWRRMQGVQQSTLSLRENYELATKL